MFRNPVKVRESYENQIKDWQQRVQEEGWTENLINDVYHGSIKLTRYKTEKGDYWDTPNEFISNGFEGDCEDMAAFIWGSFKMLNYPHEIRIRGVMTSTGDHALTVIEMPDGKWKTLESVPLNTIGGEWIFYRTFAEWDARGIY